MKSEVEIDVDVFRLTLAADDRRHFLGTFRTESGCAAGTDNVSQCQTYRNIRSQVRICDLLNKLVPV